MRNKESREGTIFIIVFFFLLAVITFSMHSSPSSEITGKAVYLLDNGIPDLNPPPIPTCGDGNCTVDEIVNETCSSCPADCGDCCGDGQCIDDETCSSCPADCGSCPSDDGGNGGSSGGGGGGGGSGGGSSSPSSLSKVTATIAELKSNSKATITLNQPKIPVSVITLTSKSDYTNVRITVEVLEDKPETVLTPSKKSYKYLDISSTNIADENISEATINFEVENSWLTKNKIDKETIKLARYNKQWKELTTAFLRTADNKSYYKAYTPSFSYFAIIGEKTKPPASLPADDLAEQSSAETPDESGGELQSNVQFYLEQWYIYILVLVVIITLVGIWIKHKKQDYKKRPITKPVIKYPYLEGYVKSQLSKNIGGDKIRAALLASGWPKETIDGVLRKFKK